MRRPEVGEVVRVLIGPKSLGNESLARVLDIIQDPQRASMKRKGWVRARVLFLEGPFLGQEGVYPHSWLRRLTLLEQIAVAASE